MDQNTNISTLKQELEYARVQIKQYAREAKIEAALEHVRSVSLTMRHTSELQQVIDTVGKQFKSLEIQNTGGVFVIINAELDHDLHVWGFGDTASYSQKVRVRSIERPIHTHLLHAIKSTKGLMTESYSNEEKIEYFRHLFQHPPYNATSREHQEEWLKRSGGYTRSCFISEHTTLFMINHHGRVFSEEENKILSRFGAVFEQSYIRFLDLQKAETQAREAQIEAALERVRARTMAMHSSDEFRETISILFNQLNLLDFNIEQCSLTIVDEHKEEAESWQSATAQSVLPRSFRMRFPDDAYFREKIRESLVQQEGYRVIEFEGEEKKQFDTYIFENTPMKHAPKEVVEFMRNHHKIVLCRAYMRYGFIETVSNTSKLNIDKEVILRRFSKVFEQTYTRFLDLKKAEAQAREAQIEAALERIRAKTMAMHQSDELRVVVAALYQEVGRLGLADWGCNIQIFDPVEKTIQIWLSEDDLKTHPRSYFFRDAQHPQIKRQWDNWKNNTSYSTISLNGQDKKSYDDYILNYTDFRHFPEEMKAGIRSLDQVHFNFARMKFGFLVSIDISSPMKEDEFRILGRFANVFEQTYTRFQDLKKAEAQAREAQIEAALERIRAASMAMHKSEDLPTVALTFFRQIEQLDIPINAASINLVNESTQSYQLYFANKHEIGITSELNIEDFWFAKESISRLKKGEKEYTIICEGDKLKAWIEFVRKEISEERGVQLEKARLLKSYVHSVQFHALSHTIFASVSALPESDLEVLRRMTKAFGMSYIRFLDLKKAEAQAREAQIEAALEKIRSAAMAMHTSDDLFNVVSVLRQQMHDLGQKDLESTLIHLYHDDVDYFDTFWSYRSTGSSDADIITGIAKVPLDNDWAQACLENYHSEKVSYLIYSERAMLREWYQVLEQIAPQTLEYDIEGRIIVPERLYYYLSKFKGGALMMITEEEAGNDAIDLQQRAAKVFGLAYQRYVDLKIAEEQTREAQIETALERVRTRSLAMHKSEELADLSLELVKQVQALGIQTWFCAFNIYDDDPKGSLEWGSNGIGTFPKYRTPREGIFLKYFEAGQNGETLLVNEIGEDACPAHYEYLCSLPGVGDQLLKMQRDGIPFPTSQVDHVAYFQYGYLIFITYQPIPESFHIFKRFAKVFEQSYTRFLDLKKAEERAREAQVEAALERVRSQTMAMQSSHDIGASVTSLFESLVDLGISEKVRCGIGILNYDNTNMDLWTASSGPESEVILNTGQIDMSQHPLLTGARNSWKNQERHFGYTLKGEDLIDYHHVINQSARYPTKIDIDTLPEEINHDSFVFDHGLLYAFADTPLPKDVVQILERLSVVFEHTYTRFLDLQQAELREKEAIKQASLDRIRAETASMRTASDLDQIIPLIWRELITLKVPFIRCGVFIMDESEKVIHNYLSTPEGEAIASFVLPFETPGTISQILSHWRKKEIFLDYWNQESMIDFSNVLVANGIFSDPKDYLVTLPQHGFHLHFLPFLQGMLYVGNMAPLDNDQIDLLQGVSHAFSTAYARFEDFKKLEVAKSQVDQALQNLQSAQQQLIHAEKMASLGELTAGIAHEIQNPLNFVNNFSEIGVELVEEIDEELKNNDLESAREILSELVQNLQKIHHHGDRASGIVRGMLDHSRAKSDEKSQTDINQLCDEYLRLAYHGLRAKNKSFQANFRLEADPDLPKVMVASQDVGRVLLNLINNGFQATLEKSKDSNIDYRPELLVKTLRRGDFIQIHVIDNGPGILKEIQEKIFQPFFTTKPTGEGTGLGLSLAYDIVKAHGGEVKVESKKNAGSTFTIDLPLNQ